MRKKTKTKVLNIRLSEWEFNELEKATKLTGQSKTSFLVMAMLEKIQRIRREIMERKEHTRNQKRMYRIHKQEEKIQELELLVGKLQQENDKLKEQQKKFIKYLEDELDRLARECSQIYEDSLGKTRLVNEDIFNEVNKILSKYKEITGVSDETN